MKTYKCDVCGKEFEAPTKAYFCPECKEKYSKRRELHDEKFGKNKRGDTCIVCGNPIPDDVKYRTACSSRCKNLQQRLQMVYYKEQMKTETEPVKRPKVVKRGMSNLDYDIAESKRLNMEYGDYIQYKHSRML